MVYNGTSQISHHCTMQRILNRKTSNKVNDEKKEEKDEIEGKTRSREIIKRRKCF